MNIPQLKRMLWIMNEITASTPLGGITRNELNDKWERSCQNDYDGKRIPERTFYRIISDLKELFECEIAPSPGTQRYTVKVDCDGTPDEGLTLLEILLKKNTHNSISQLLQMVVGGNDIPPEDMRVVRDLSAAVGRLPQIYAEDFLNCATKIKGIDSVAPDRFYRNYICVWNEALYLRTNQWLSIGFYDDEICFYLVTNEQDPDERARKATEAGFGEGVRYRGGYYWHEPIDPELFTMPYPMKPDMQEVIRRAEILQAKLETVDSAIK